MQLWNELRRFGSDLDHPWCIAGDFNVVLHDREKIGGAPFNYNLSIPFADCIDACKLVDLGFKGPCFTWKRGNLRERLDRVLSNTAWRTTFRSHSVIHIPIQTFDHYVLWFRTNIMDDRQKKRNYFKFLSSWLDHSDFRNQVLTNWQHTSLWNDNIFRLSNALKKWNRDVFGNIFQKKRRILSRLEGINKVLLSENNCRLEELWDKLWDDYSFIV